MSLPTPITRKESYLAAIAGEQVQVPEKPITREEAYLDAIAKGGGGGEIIVDPVPTQGSTNAVSSGGTYTALEGKLDASEKGTASGVAELDANGKVLSSQLPSFVDDVVEGYYDSTTDRFYEESTFENVIDPVEGKSWIDIPANKSYRWTGSVYVRVDEGVQIGDTSNSAFRGDWGKALKDTMGTGTLDTTAQTVIPAINELNTNKATTADITNAINALDVSSVGGTGKYISAISEADGKISATEETMDITPTANSVKPVTSGGVKTAIDDSVSLKTATGNPITLTDAANANAEELLMTIEPVQSGSGDPSPTNVRPISGLTEGVVQTTNGTDTNNATITFGQTVYGGSVNFKTGKVTVTHGMVDLGTLDWTFHPATSSYNDYFDTVLPNDSILGDSEIAANIISPIYKTIPSKWIAYPEHDNNVQALAKDSRRFITCDSRYNNAADYTTAMTGIVLVYELATPTTLTLTPAELELLKGNNTITANGAEISIKYYPDNAIGVLAGRVDKKADKEAVDAEIGDLSQTGLTGDSVAAQLNNAKGQIDGKVEIQNNAGFHNSIYRGKFLGTEVTQEQWDAIAAGTFDDMYIGDYWTIDGVNYRIAHLNYWFDSGDIACQECHVLIVPDTNLYTAKMNNSNITTGAYVGSAMYTTNLAQAKTTINNAFGASHILNHREYLANAMKATADPTYESAGSWYDSTVELMNERMVYGADVFHNVEVNGAIPYSYTIDKSQLALFALDLSRICNRVTWWLRCAVSAAYFAFVEGNGLANYSNASGARGVRPAFGIKA